MAWSTIQYQMGSPHTPMLQRPTILMVDDYLDALDVWRLYLTSIGFSVSTAADGLTAIDIASENLPDLIVLDLDLPGKTGIEVAALLRAQESTHHIPLIAVTGCSQTDQLDLARATGFAAVLIKPCDPSVLVREIRRLLPTSGSPHPAGDGHGDAQHR